LKEGVPKKFTQEWYDCFYFKDQVGKSFRQPNGTLDYWGYRNEEGEWDGAEEIVKAWKEMFSPVNLLDVGAGRGLFLAYARNIGIEAEGFDYSKWAVSDEGRYGRCKREWLRLHDATKPWPYKDGQFDLVVSLDFYEHIYEENLDFVIKEMYRVANKWVFLQICTGEHSRTRVYYILKRGEPVSLEFEGYAVAGHVTVQSESFWDSRFESNNWWTRRDLVEYFCYKINPEVISNWVKNTIIILEKCK